MSDFKLMAKILSAVKSCEQERQMDVSLFQPEVLGASEGERDSMIVKLQEDGYVDGFYIVDEVDNLAYPAVMLKHSRPRITIKGMEYIEQNAPLNKAIKALKETATKTAIGKLTGAILTL